MTALPALPLLRRITGRNGRFEVSRLHRSGVDPRRVLMIGDRSVLGDVDAPLERRLPEQLADRLVRASGRGLDLDVLTDLTPALAAVRGTFARWRLWRYDAVLLVVDTAAAGTTTDRHLAALLDEVASDAAVHAGVVVNLVRRTRSGHGRHHPDRQPGVWDRPDAVDPDIVWLLVRVSPGPNEPLPATDVERVAGDLAATIDGAGPVGRLADPPEDDEFERQRALQQSGAVDRPQETELDHIVALAQEAFGAQSAELNFLDADRSWHVAVAGAARGSHPRATSYCNLAIQESGPTVIGDARSDPRVGHLANIPGVPAFYAAYPIESIDGYRIGVLCVYDPRPRDVDEVDVSLLRDLAMLAEAEIIDPSGPRTSALRTVAPVG